MASLIIFLFIFLFVPGYLRQGPRNVRTAGGAIKRGGQGKEGKGERLHLSLAAEPGGE